jgi:transcriptional regulator with XRE-family HTH domain
VSFVFYEQFKRACSENSTTVTDIVKELKISNGSLSNWKNGIIPNGDTLIKIADRLNVPIDYLLDRVNISSMESPLITVTRQMVNTPARVASLNSGKTISDEQLKLISPYLGCTISFLFGGEYIYKPDTNRQLNPKAFETVAEILDCCADNDNYKTVQIQISLIVWSNIKQKGIDLNTENFGVSSSVIKEINAKYENPLNDEKVKNGFYISDLFKIKRGLYEKGININIEYMFTGIDNPIYIFKK